MGKNNIELLRFAESFKGKGGAIFRSYCGLGSNDPYCCAFITYLFQKGGDSALFYGGKRVTYCPNALSWCRANLAMIPLYMALPSDIIYFDWQPNGIPDHIGLVRERKSCDAIYTIEGNTSGGIVDYKTRPAKYILGVYRPHFPATFDATKELVIDGLAGYNTIAVLQRALGVTVDGILGKGTVRALQKRAGTTQDGHWGNGTSRAVQKMLGVTADGLFGPNSVKALQRWCNKMVFPQQSTWVDKGNAYARKISSEKYHYVRWKSGVAATHTCPICTGRKYDNYFGWNCIGYAFSIWRHGLGLNNRCSCGVISSGKNGQWDRLLSMSQAEADKYATSLVGVPVKVIRNGGKALPLSSLKAGDICCLYKNGTAEHIIYYMGNGKYSDSNTTGGIGNAKNIRADLTLSSSFKSKLKLAIRYNGK